MTHTNNEKALSKKGFLTILYPVVLVFSSWALWLALTAGLDFRIFSFSMFIYSVPGIFLGLLVRNRFLQVPFLIVMYVVLSGLLFPCIGSSIVLDNNSTELERILAHSGQNECTQYSFLIRGYVLAPFMAIGLAAVEFWRIYKLRGVKNG